MSDPIEAEYLGVIDGYHCYTGWRRAVIAGRPRMFCQGYRAERVRDAPVDGEDVWYSAYDDLIIAIHQSQVTP